MPLFSKHPEIDPRISLSDDRQIFSGHFSYQDLPELGSGKVEAAVPVDQVVAVAGGEAELKKLNPSQRAARLTRAFVFIVISIPFMRRVFQVPGENGQETNHYVTF